MGDVYITGNTVIDALQQVANRQLAQIPEQLEDIYNQKSRLVLVTTHRRENWGGPIRRICKAVREIVDAVSDVHVVFSVHPNPSVRSIVLEELNGTQGVTLLSPLSYAPFVQLMKRSYLILTDSGGIQEEAPSLGKPVLVLRDVTERPEGVEAGVLRVVGTSPDRIVRETVELLTDDLAYRRMAQTANPYGDGHASERIVAVLKQRLTDGI